MTAHPRLRWKLAKNVRIGDKLLDSDGAAWREVTRVNRTPMGFIRFSLNSLPFPACPSLSFYPDVRVVVGVREEAQ